ncbi:hypothetical protein ACQ4PT_051004 [Festuca glaucescens]
MVNTTAASMASGGMLPLASLNHISVVCRSVEESLDFYMNVLGFVPIRRPDLSTSTAHGCSIMGLASTFCNRRTPKVCTRRRRSTPRITTSLSSARVWWRWSGV